MDDRAHDLAVVLDILEDVGTDHALIGGLAVGYHGYERATIDVDMLVPGRSLKRVADAARDRGYVVRTFLPDMIRIYPAGTAEENKSIADLVSAESNPVLRAAFREVEPVDLLGEQVNVVTFGTLIALKFHAAVSPARAIEDKYQDVADIGHLVKARFTQDDNATGHRIASLAYPGAGEDFDSFINDLRHGRLVRI